jgi:precorrin-6B methylase 2
LEKIWWNLLPQVPGGRIAKTRLFRKNFFFRVQTPVEAIRHRNAGEDHAWMAAWLREHLQEDDVLYDVGAGVGIFSLLAAKLRDADDEGRVFAFESEPALVEKLCDNISLNRCDGTVVPVPVTLSSTNGILSGKLCFRLDDLLEPLGLPRPNHMRVSGSGAEREILTGSASTLRDPSLRTLMVETSTERFEAVASILGSKGFKLFHRFSSTGELAPIHELWKRT